MNEIEFVYLRRQTHGDEFVACNLTFHIKLYEIELQLIKSFTEGIFPTNNVTFYYTQDFTQVLMQ